MIGWFKCNQSRVLVQVNQSEVLVFVKSVLSFWFMCNQFKVLGSSVTNLSFLVQDDQSKVSVVVKPVQGCWLLVTLVINSG